MAARYLFLCIAMPLPVPAARVALKDGLDAKEQVNASSFAYWQLFGRTGPKMSDVKQGQLGDCYYLAALAAIARTHPKLIERAFVMQGEKTSKRSSLKVYQAQFLVDGVVTTVALDEKVPVQESKTRTTRGRFFFASTNDGHDVWPILLEKGFAKIFGSYLAIRAGLGYDAFKAITQAPVDILTADFAKDQETHQWENAEAVWKALGSALRNDFPITGSAFKNSFGTVAGHEFAIIGYGTMEGYGRVVKVYNPWASHMYRGKMKRINDRFKGDYYMTFDEFLEAFRTLTIAYVRENHRISYTWVPVDKPTALKFTIRGGDPFAVQLEWPTDRFVDVFGCRLRQDHMKLLVARKGEAGSWVQASQKFMEATSNLRVDVQGAGEYLVYAYGSFEGAPWAEQMAVNVYAGEDVVFETLDDALGVGREMVGFPCVDVVEPTLSGYYISVYQALPYPIQGSPAWQQQGRDPVLWVNQEGRLVVSPSQSRLREYFASFPKLQCKSPSASQGAPRSYPLPALAAVGEIGCGFKVGERVHYAHGSQWICGQIDAAYSNAVTVRYLLQGRETVGCKSPKVSKVEQCSWHQGDEVEVFTKSGWVIQRIAEVGCGTVELSDGAQVKCSSGSVRYPHGCPFHKREKVLVWSRTLNRWTFATVADVVQSQVSLRYGKGMSYAKELPCGDENLKKLSRCDKLSHDQIARWKKLDNVDEIVDTGRDSLFPARVDSIGPFGADCGDSARGGDPEPCDKFNTWGAISDVLH